MVHVRKCTDGLYTAYGWPRDGLLLQLAAQEVRCGVPYSTLEGSAATSECSVRDRRLVCDARQSMRSACVLTTSVETNLPAAHGARPRTADTPLQTADRSNVISAATDNRLSVIGSDRSSAVQDVAVFCASVFADNIVRLYVAFGRNLADIRRRDLR